MGLLEWNDSYSVDVADIDIQHRRLIDLINELSSAMSQDQREHSIASAVDELEAVSFVLGELLDYAAYHFSNEESQMLEHRYPGYKAHLAAHRYFIETVRGFKRDLNDAKPLRSRRILDFLQTWLVDHILMVDKQLGAFLSSRRAPQT
jgi:hemerythrin